MSCSYYLIWVMTDQELLKKIEEVTGQFRGQVDDLSGAIGLVMLGRLVGWRVVRLTLPRRTWMTATRLFGDLKQLLPERGRYAHKSLALKIVDQIGGYWDFIRGTKDALPLHDRKEMM